MTSVSPLDLVIDKYRTQLEKALTHLEYSHQKVLKLSTKPDSLSEDELADFESFSSRFSRVVDLFLTKYIKAVVKKDDPGFDGTLRDYVNYAEKMKLIDNANLWMDLRELRNIEAHTYEDELEAFLDLLMKNAPHLLALRSIFTKKP